MSDNIFLRRVFGELTVVFEEGGQRTFPVDGQMIGEIVAELDMMILRQAIWVTDAHNPPYEMISYDEEEQVITVRRKPARGD